MILSFSSFELIQMLTKTSIEQSMTAEHIDISQATRDLGSLLL